MLGYRILRAIDRAYPLALLWIYVAAFVLAMALMFVFPPGTLIMLGLGLASLGVAILVKKLLALIVRCCARMILRGGACPACGHRFQTIRDATADWRCEACRALFLPGGAEPEPAAPLGSPA